ncbi:MAG: YceI family protein [Parvularculaceae bacterium]|nr:YceI family protein [Parvularculaceae bacterium]
MRRDLMVLAVMGLAACGNSAQGEAAASDASGAASGEAAAASEAAVERAAAPAGVYATDPGHAYIAFSYSHMKYSHPIVRWRSWSAELDWNPDAPEESSVEATIDVNSIDTGVDALDEHLRSADFFGAEAYPTIVFKSTGLELTGPNTGKMTGDLTIRETTKPITLDVRINRAADDGFAKAYKLGFSAKGKLSRTEFDVGRYAPTVGDEVDFSIESEFLMPKEGASG